MKSTFTRRVVTLLCTLVWMALVALPLGAAQPSFTIATPPYTFVFPRDHGAHPGYQSEWWYYTGHLRTPDGRRFGYELTFFRIGLRPGDAPPARGTSAWRGHELYPAHFAITDDAGKTFFHTERLSREALGAGYAATGGLDVRVGDWYVRGSNPMRMHAAAQGNALDLTQTPLKPPAIHGHDGVSRKGACRSCASHYYSMTRLRTQGTLTFHGVRMQVAGLSWMDHEFGSSELEPNQAGWDWFALQLDDGRELMLYSLRQKDGGITPQSSGSLIAVDGSVTYLPRSAFRIASTGTWKSPHTGGVYPQGWRVSVPQARIDLVLAPTVADQELADTTGGISYWEGEVDVTDASTGRAIGLGYVELTGYARAIAF